MDDVLTNTPIILDNGTGFIKAGFAGEEAPKAFFNNVIGRPKHIRVMGSSVEDKGVIGKKTQESRGLLRLSGPMDHAIVEHWDDMETIWQYAFEELAVSSDNHTLLVTEAALNPRSHREKMAEVFFESFNVPALHFALPAVLSLYATGRTTGLVLDCGEGATQCVPVYDGFALPKGIFRNDIAGCDVTRQLQLLLRKEGYLFNTSAELDLVRTVKEAVCAVWSRKEAGTAVASEMGMKASKQKAATYTLPDGKPIRVGGARHAASEILFQPHLVGDEALSVQEMLASAAQKADVDIRSHLLSNVLLSGGATLTRGFGKRVVEELQASPSIARGTKIRVSAPPERLYTAYIGGSILASLNTFRRMWVTSAEYREHGPTIFSRRSFG
eukprot:Clim_evm5s191 gene=Clim_evmTU5s191